MKTSGPGQQIHQPSEIKIHSNYDPKTLFNDIGLVKLQRDAAFTDYVRPICLWEGDTDITRIHNQLGIIVLK